MKSDSDIPKSIENISVAETIDACGARCPLPLLYAKQALKKRAVGEVIRILTTDPSAKGDFDSMLKHLPHELVAYAAYEGAEIAALNMGNWPNVEAFYILKCSAN